MKTENFAPEKYPPYKKLKKPLTYLSNWAILPADEQARANRTPPQGVVDSTTPEEITTKASDCLMASQRHLSRYIQMRVNCHTYEVCTVYGGRVTIVAESREQAIRTFNRTYPHEKIVGVTYRGSY